MASRYKIFDRSQLKLQPLSARTHELNLSCLLPLKPADIRFPEFESVAKKIIRAGQNRRATILMIGGHVIRSGVQHFLIDLMRKGFISCIAVNGAVVIHDFELALIGATTESVSRYIQTGAFGFWQETGTINTIVTAAAENNQGMGEAIGKYIVANNCAHADISILAAAYKLAIPVTVHVGVGYDITHQYPNCDARAIGQTSYTDFLIFTEIVRNLSDGVVMNFGTAVMGPEIFLKALSMARNRAHQNNRAIENFTSLVCDIRAVPHQYRQEAARTDPHYFFRPLKTLLVRTPGEKGSSYYVQGAHRTTIPSLYTSIIRQGTQQ